MSDDTFELAATFPKTSYAAWLSAAPGMSSVIGTSIGNARAAAL